MIQVVYVYVLSNNVNNDKNDSLFRQIIHTDNGGEFINMCFDAKYKGVRFAHLTDEEFKRTKTIVSESLVHKV